MGNGHDAGAEARRLDYLRRMGIDVYRSRAAGARAAPARAMDAAEPVERPAEPAPAGDSDIAGCDWDTLEALVRRCTRCPLHATRTNPVFGVGDRNASLMIVGEAPGAEEDRRGEPFVGRGGQLLDQMLRAIGLARGAVYITNILKSRPPGNRDPEPEEAAACEPYLERQLELVSPGVILAVGRVAAQHLLQTDQPLGRLRGGWHRYGPRNTPLLATYHPAYLLRKPAEKRKAWEDLKRVRERLRTAVEEGR